MPDTDKAADLAAAYRTINEADPETARQLKRLRALHKRTGESSENAERQISEILENGPGAADRLRGTADAVARRWNLDEDEGK